jgi:hypothetical protein
MQNAVARRDAFADLSRGLFLLACDHKTEAKTARLEQHRIVHRQERKRLLKSALFYRRHARMDRGEA